MDYFPATALFPAQCGRTGTSADTRAVRARVADTPDAGAAGYSEEVIDSARTQ